MDDCCQLDSDKLSKSQRSTLVKVMAINLVMFLVVLVSAFFANSSSLLSGTIDNLGDAFTYGLSLYAVSKSDRFKAKVSMVKGFLILIAAISVMIHIIYKLRSPEVPDFEVMSLVTILSLMANATCLALLWKHRDQDINMASVWECSRNDVVENLSVLLAALGIWLLDSQWPDIVIAGILLLILLRSALRIIRSSFLAHKVHGIAE